MQQIIQINKPSTMSSRDISELTGKEHKNVCRDIRNMLDVLGKDRLSFEHIFKDADWLRMNGWTYRRAGSSVDLGYQDKCNAGLLTHKVTTLHLEDGDKACQQVLVTARGLTKLAQIFGVQVQQELSGV